MATATNKFETLPLPVDRRILFSEQVDQRSISSLTQKILDINESDEHLMDIYKFHGIKGVEVPPIRIYIDSYGGQVYQVFGLVSIMENSKTPIHTYVTGAAMSAGFIILISGHRRFAYPHSTPLYHQVSSYMGSNTAKEHEENLTEIIRLQKKMEKMVLEKTKITAKKLNDIYKRKTDWTMTAKQALKYGVVDEIVK
jgi:ATP-dependent Clp protease protease subunit